MQYFIKDSKTRFALLEKPYFLTLYPKMIQERHQKNLGTLHFMVNGGWLRFTLYLKLWSKIHIVKTKLEEYIEFKKLSGRKSLVLSDCWLSENCQIQTGAGGSRVRA